MKIVPLIIFCFNILLAQPEVPQLGTWATDYTRTLSAGQLDQLNRKLKSYEDTTGTQLIALMIATLQDYPIEEYTLQVAEKNKIGTEKNDNGILLMVAKNDRKLRIEVGYGLEGVIPDALASSIIRNTIIPYFKRDQYYEGIDAGIDAIIMAAAGEYKQDKKEDSKPVSGMFSFLFMLFLLIMFFLRGSGRRKGIVFLPGGLGGWGGRGKGGFGGGGFGGGGFGGGGFSGGGGGFGGGGASGSW